MSRTTAVLATLFFMTSLGLSYLLSRGQEPTSIIDRVQTEQTMPAAPTDALPGILPGVPEPAATVPSATPEPAPEPTAGE